MAAVEALRPLVVGRRTDELFADMGGFWRTLVGDSQLRWIGPEKGVIHLATAAVVNAVWDLYAKTAGKPLWKLICDMTPEEQVALVDFRYISDALTPERALERLRDPRSHARGPRGGAGPRRLPGIRDVDRLAGLRRRQDPATVPRGARRRLDRVQAEGRRRRRGRPAAGGHRSRGDRAGPDHGGRREPALGRRRGDRLDGPAARVRPVLDRGAHLAGRHPRPRGDRPRRRADPGRDRRARPQPGDVQAAAPGRGDRVSARSTHAGSAA